MRLANRVLIHFNRSDYFNTGTAYSFSRDLAEGISAIRGRRTDLVWPFLFTLNNKALLLLVLAFTFSAPTFRLGRRVAD
jgi:hypothetical protein